MTRDEAIRQGAALKAAAEASPVRMVRDELRRRANEYRRAIKDLDGINGRPDTAGGDDLDTVVPTSADEWLTWLDQVCIPIAAGESGIREATEVVLERLRPDIVDGSPSVDDRGAIELVGTVGPGMYVLDAGNRDETWSMVLRTLEGGGQTSLHLESERQPQGVYRNFAGPSSPVVVLL